MNISKIFAFAKNPLERKSIHYNKNIILKTEKMNENILLSKIDGISTLVRSQNILPTLILTFSGGWIVNPNIVSLLQSSQFLTSNLVIIGALSLSMVLNDFFDIEMDKINNPGRPLITGQVTKKEAIIFSFILVSSMEIVSTLYLSKNLQLYLNYILGGIILYSPVIKKIPFIKNIFCAYVIAFSMYFSALSIQPNLNYESFNYNILITAMRYIFLGSLSIELLLDICDLEGDKKNNVNTVPVLVGKEKTLNLVMSLVLFNIGNILFMMKTIHYIPSLLVLFFTPMVIDIHEIQNRNYEKAIITKSVKRTVLPMFGMLLSLCFLNQLNLT
jgi:geranylgeranylglycerol-phosphate geranylgeranyltransferase